MSELTAQDKFGLCTLTHPMTCSDFGQKMWGTASRPQQAYARPAGRMLKRLRTLGFVTPLWIRGDPRHLFKRTWAGERVAADYDRQARAALG